MKASLLAVALAAACLMPFCAAAQESPYFVTYDDHLEEPRNLEITPSLTAGVPRAHQSYYLAPYIEFEYGLTPWWTTELYLEAQSTHHDSAIFTGWRLENRWRPLRAQHVINPVLYLEYEHLNEGTRIQKELVGHAPSFVEPNRELHRIVAHEIEAKLILSSNWRSWNVSENVVFEKNLSASEGVEFGYSFGVARPLHLPCRWCRQRTSAGVEIYGGLGSSRQFGLPGTAQYVAPVLSWRVGSNAAIRLSPALNLRRDGSPVLLRFGYTQEIVGFGSTIARWFQIHRRSR